MRYLFAGLLTALAVIGCGPGGGGNPTNLVSVKGKVVGADGKPLPWVQLNFYPTERGSTMAYASAGAEGTFTAQCMDKQDGMVPGRYKVTVAPIKGKAGAPKLDAKLAEDSSTTLTAEVGRATSDLVIEVK